MRECCAREAAEGVAECHYITRLAIYCNLARCDVVSVLTAS